MTVTVDRPVTERPVPERPVPERPGPLRPVRRPLGARFPRGGFAPAAAPSGIATLPAHPVGARFPRVDARAAAERVPVSFAGATGSRRLVGARFPRR